MAPSEPRFDGNIAGGLMRTVLRVVLEGSAILAVALLTAALHCALRSLRARRAAAADNASGELITPAQIPARRPTFLSRGNLLSS